MKPFHRASPVPTRARPRPGWRGLTLAGIALTTVTALAACGSTSGGVPAGTTSPVGSPTGAAADSTSATPTDATTTMAPTGAATPTSGQQGTVRPMPPGPGTKPTIGQGPGGPVRAIATRGDVILTVLAQRSVDQLTVDYTLTNTGPAELVAVDRIPTDLGGATLPADLDPTHAWVLAGDGGVTRISKQGFAIAPGVRFAAAPVIGARPLPAGGSLAGSAVVPLPPTTDLPGPSFAAPRTKVVLSTTRMQVCVQVRARVDQDRPSPTDPGVLVTPVAAPGPDETVCTDAMVLPAS